MQIFSLHWMMQNISFLMFSRSPSCFTDIKKPNVLHHAMQAKNLHFDFKFLIVGSSRLLPLFTEFIRSPPAIT